MGHSYVLCMRRLVWIFLVAALVWVPMPTVLAQDADAAAAEARRQAEEERYRRLNSVIEQMQADQVAIMNKLSKLGDEIGHLRDEIDRIKNKPAPNFASPEDVRRLADKVQELDQKRDSERRQMLDKLEKLAEMPPPTKQRETKERKETREPAPSNTSSTPAVEMKGYEYVVQKGDSLSAIVAEYRKQGVKVTVDMVLKANTGLKANNLYVGKRIFIPDPALK